MYMKNKSLEWCAKCKNVSGFMNLHVNPFINEWLCLKCDYLYFKELEIFNENFCGKSLGTYENSIEDTYEHPDPIRTYKYKVKVKEVVKIHENKCDA